MNPRARFIFPIVTLVALLSLAACGGSDSGTSVAADSMANDSIANDSIANDGPVEGAPEAGGEGGIDTGSSTETSPTCPPNDNPPGCADHYFEIPKGAACSPVGLSCRYYGEGDEPCPSYAACTCDVPTGSDGGTATWTHCVQ